MEIYLIPLSAGYGLYAESPVSDPATEAELPGTFFGRLARRANAYALALEREESASGSGGGVRAGLRRWAARRVREQRVLWQLRREQAVTIVAPEDCSEVLATDVVRRLLKRDADRHRRWLVIDSVGFVASGVLMLIPGPNLVAYYFALSLAGRVLSLQGAQHARQRVAWHVRPDPALVELRAAIAAPPAERAARVHAIADRLHLPSLPGYFARAVSRSA
jgi:hypothetical protein